MIISATKLWILTKQTRWLFWPKPYNITTKTNQKVTYEYIAFNGFNDNIEDARDLVKFCQYVPCKVNIIEYNQVEGVPYHKSSEDRLTQFQNYLMANKVNTTVRRSRGKDIDAACGQLANKN